MATVTSSKQFSLGKADFWKGLIMAVGTPVLYILQELIPNWPLNPIEKAALSALVTYLVKNFFTPAAVVVTGVKNDTIDDIKAGDKDVVIK